MYYKKIRRKQIIKSSIIISIILLIAVFATHNIYYKFNNERDVDYSSESLDITFHEKSGDKLTLTKVTPVTDSVGLSSKAYTFTIKNNLTLPVDYKIKVIEDNDVINSEGCSGAQIPKDIIKIAIKSEKGTNIYNLNELADGILLQEKIKALDNQEYTVRIWTTNNSLQSSANLHYHGKIQIIEDSDKTTK